MQTSGNTNLLNEAHRHALIELSSEQEQLQSIIEKVINSSINLDDKKNGYLGYPDDLFEKLGKTASEDNKLEWLIHQHLLFSRLINLYYYIGNNGQIIKETSENTILILKGKIT